MGPLRPDPTHSLSNWVQMQRIDSQWLEWTRLPRQSKYSSLCPRHSFFLPSTPPLPWLIPAYTHISASMHLPGRALCICSLGPVAPSESLQYPIQSCFVVQPVCNSPLARQLFEGRAPVSITQEPSTMPGMEQMLNKHIFNQTELSRSSVRPPQLSTCPNPAHSS